MFRNIIFQIMQEDNGTDSTLMKLFFPCQQEHVKESLCQNVFVMTKKILQQKEHTKQGAEDRYGCLHLSLCSVSQYDRKTVERAHSPGLLWNFEISGY